MGFRPLCQGLAQHVAGLRHGALGGVHQQQHAVGHLQHPLDLAAEVGVAGGVDDVDVVVVARAVGVVDRAVLGQDRDAPLALQRVGVEDALALQFALAELAALAEELVDQRRLAVVDVGDDGDVANLLIGHGNFLNKDKWVNGVDGLKLKARPGAGRRVAAGPRQKTARRSNDRTMPPLPTEIACKKREIT